MGARGRRAVVLGAAALSLELVPAPPVAAQSGVTISLEAAALGARWLHPVGGGWAAGVEAALGPRFGVRLAGDELDGARTWASASLTFASSSAGGVRGRVSPIGAALVVGNDYAALYPAAEAGAETEYGRLRAGSGVRVLRVAGANGTGEWRAWWVPLRLGYTLGR